MHMSAGGDLDEFDAQSKKQAKKKQRSVEDEREWADGLKVMAQQALALPEEYEDRGVGMPMRPKAPE